MSESEEEPPKERQAQSHWQQDGDGADGFDVCDVKYDFIMHSTEWIIGLAMWSCILISIALHWDDTTQTHCGVSNWLPSMSAAIGNNFPQRMIWRGAIALTLYQRLYDSVLYFRYHAFYFSKRQHVAVAAASPSAADGCSPAVARMVHVAPASAYGTSSVNSASTQSYPLHCQPCDGSTGAAGGSSTVFSCNSGPTANRRARGAKDANVNTSEDVRLGVVSRAPIMNPTLSSGGTRLPFALNLLHTCFLVGENLSLALLTYVSSTESHALHELGFVMFLLCATVEMPLHIAIFALHRRWRTHAHFFSRRLAWSYALKCASFAAQLVFAGLAGLFFYRHNAYCEAGVFSLFALMEYGVVLANMAFHYTTVLDFDFRIRVTQTHARPHQAERERRPASPSPTSAA